MNVKKAHHRSSPGAGLGQKVQVTEISPHPSPRARTLYFVGSVVLVIVKSWKMHFLLFTLPLSFPCVHHIKTFFTIFHCIVYKHWFWMMCRWCVTLCFVTKTVSHQTHPFTPVTLGDNLRVNILCRSSRFNSAANPISGIVWSSYSGGHSNTDHIWIIQVFCPPPPPFSANDIHYSNWT